MPLIDDLLALQHGSRAAGRTLALDTFSHITLPRDVLTAMSNLKEVEQAIVALLAKEGHPAPGEMLRQIADRKSLLKFGLPAPHLATLAGAGLVPRPGAYRNVPIPIDWDDIREDILGPRSIRTVLQLQYDVMLEAVSEVQPVGNWMFVIADLMRPVESPQLLISLVPDLVARHPATSIDNIDATVLREVVSAIGSARDSVRQRYEDASKKGKLEPLIKLAKWVWANLEKLYIAAEAAKAAHDAAQAAAAARQAEEEKLHKAILESRPNRDWQDHLDIFDRNRDWIEKTC